MTNKRFHPRPIGTVLLLVVICLASPSAKAAVILSSTPGDNYVLASDSGYTPFRGTVNDSGSPLTFAGAGSFSTSAPQLSMNNQTAGPSVVSASADSSVTIDTSNGGLIVTQPVRVDVSVLSQGSAYSGSAAASMQLKFTVTDPYETIAVSNTGYPWGGTAYLTLMDTTAGKPFYSTIIGGYPPVAVPTTPLAMGDTYTLTYGLNATTTSSFYSYGSPQGAYLTGLDFSVTSAPEPTSIALIFLGGAGLLHRRRVRL